MRKKDVYIIYFAIAAVAVDSTHMTASSPASWSRFNPPSNFVDGHVSTMWFTVCRWPQSQEGDWARLHLSRWNNQQTSLSLDRQFTMLPFRFLPHSEQIWSYWSCLKFSQCDIIWRGITTRGVVSKTVLFSHFRKNFAETATADRAIFGTRTTVDNKLIAVSASNAAS